MRCHAPVTASVSHCGGGASTTLTAKSSSPGRISLSPWSARIREFEGSAGEDQQDFVGGGGQALGGVAGEIEPAAGGGVGRDWAEARLLGDDDELVRVGEERVDALFDDPVDLRSVGLERVVAVHHAGDPGA